MSEQGAMERANHIGAGGPWARGERQQWAFLPPWETQQLMEGSAHAVREVNQAPPSPASSRGGPASHETVAGAPNTPVVLER